MPATLRAAWLRWMAIAESISHVQAKILISALYVVVVAPFAIGLRLFADPLEMRRNDGSRWRPLSRQTKTLEAARRQF